jgi:transposase-like protein
MGQPITPPEKEQLQALYEKQGLSVYALGKKYGVNDKTAKNWLQLYNIPVRTKNEQHAITHAKIRNAEPLKLLETQRVNALNDPEGGEKSENVAKMPSDESEDETPFGRLTRNQKEAVVLLADLDSQTTEEAICQRIGINQQTLRVWKKNPDFHYCLMSMRKTEMERELTMRWAEDMLARYTKGGRDLTTTDRELTAKVLGLFSDGSVTNVSVNIKEDNILDGRFRR